MMNWSKLPALFPRETLHPAALAAAQSTVPGPWCVAFSGGADSLALLLTLWIHWPEQRAGMIALHFNHRLRGAESEADEVFCREVCASLGVVFRTAAWADSRPGVSEAEARRARHDFFSTAMAACGSRVLFTGHQLDDVAETLLMRLARGSGTSGLAAPRPVQAHADGRVFLRPLLTYSKEQIVAALTQAGAVWREDISNTTGDFFRNRVRLEVLPQLRAAAGNDALAGAALSRELLDEDDAALDAWLAEVLPAAAMSATRCEVQTLRGKPRALWRRGLRRWLPAANLARAGFTELLQICEAGTGQMTAAQGVIVLADEVLTYAENKPDASTPWEPFILRAGEAVEFAEGVSLRLTPMVFDAAARARIRGGDVDVQCEVFLADSAVQYHVRQWRAGDRFHPLGAPGSAKVQDLFVNRKIPVALRSVLPMVCAEDGSIVWIPGFPPAENLKLKDDSITGGRLTYHAGTSTVRPQSKHL